MSARHLELGRAGEDAAANYLKSRGFRILERNWMSKSLELDIVAEKDGDIVFVEVKTRKAGSLATPEDALTLSKQRALVRAASLYLSSRGLWARNCRFDLCAVQPDGNGELAVVHIENAFDHTQALGAPDSWQPW